MEQENTATMESTQDFSASQGQIISTGDWVLTFLISAIPIVNIIMLFVWGFGAGTPASKSNWAKAALIWMAIIMGIYIIVGVIAGASIMSAMG